MEQIEIDQDELIRVVKLINDALANNDIQIYMACAAMKILVSSIEREHGFSMKIHEIPIDQQQVH